MKSLITALVLALGTTAAQADTMKMAVTTSFNNSGLSDVLLPAIKEDLDLDVQLLIVGTGQALRLGEAGDVDAILVHSKKAEEAFVADGYGTHRREIMYNDFVLIGPNDDPAAIKDAEAAKDALVKIEAAEALVLALGTTAAQADTMKMAVTTSFNNSGLSDVLLPAIKEDLDLDVQLLIVGTGQALRLGEAGDVDAILVHSKKAEEAFVADGYGTHRREIMYNDFVLIGPNDDPAAIKDAEAAKDALVKIEAAEAPFVSRGDDSGTHKKELSLWAGADLDPATFGEWYKAVGAGMGASLNTAAGMGAYIMSDRASWLNFDNKADLAILFAGDPVLFNQYAYIPVNPEKHAHVNKDAAAQLEDWLVGDRAKDLIDSYTINGEKLFTFNAEQ